MKDQSAVASVSVKLFLLSLLSPLAGILVEISLAYTFGSSALVDAYRISFLLLMFGTQLFFGQLITGVLVPLVADYKTKGMEQEGWQIAFSIAGVIVMITLPGVIFVVVNPENLQQFLGPGLTGEAALQAQLMLRYFAIVFVIYIWTGVINGLLHSYHVFWVQPIGQLVNNVLLVCLVMLVGGSMQESVFIIAIGLASLFSILLYATAIQKLARRHSVLLRICFHLKLSLIPLDVFKLAFPIVILIIASQWSTLVINSTLSVVSVGAVADYGYALKLQMLGSLLPLTLATVLFPRLADAASGNDMVRVMHLANRGLKWMLFFSVPAAVIVFLVREPLVAMFYQHGEMNDEGIKRVSNFLGVLSFVVPVAALNHLLYKVSYAMKNAVTPLIGQLIVAVGLSLIATASIRWEQEIGIISAYVILTWVAVVYLITALQLRYGLWSLRGTVWYALRLMLAIIVAGLAMKCILFIVPMVGLYGRIGDITEVVFSVATGLTVFLTTAWLLKMQEILDLVNWIQRLCRPESS